MVFSRLCYVIFHTAVSNAAVQLSYKEFLRTGRHKKGDTLITTKNVRILVCRTEGCNQPKKHGS